MIKSRSMYTMPFGSDELVHALLKLSRTEHVSILDSCGVGHLGSHLMIAGIEPLEIVEISKDLDEVISRFDRLEESNLAAIFTLSYDLGVALQGRSTAGSPTELSEEPFAFCAVFDVLVVHDYDKNISFIAGDPRKFDQIINKIRSEISDVRYEIPEKLPKLISNFLRAEYLDAVEWIKEKIRDGETYQTNLTRRIAAELPDELTPETIFARLRRDHPAPFAAFIRRLDSTVVSASPERFFKISCKLGSNNRLRRITTSPIKGTRRRGRSSSDDNRLRNELLTSEKDRAENTMIVDLLRNDLGRVCEYGSVEVEKLCDIEEHPSLFHLVSTVAGDLRPEARFSDILKALFPCGSITGAPKISTMKIIDQIEPDPRGLSMGAIGCSIPNGFGIEPAIDLSVAIRTMVVKDGTAKFNVGGGIVIDSDPESEYRETETKAAALLNAMGVFRQEQTADDGV